MPIQVTLDHTLDAWQVEHDRALTPAQLATTLEVEEATIAGLLQNRADAISFRLLDRLCTALDCTPNDILRHTADPEDQDQLSARLGGDLGTSIAG